MGRYSWPEPSEPTADPTARRGKRESRTGGRRGPTQLASADTVGGLAPQWAIRVAARDRAGREPQAAIRPAPGA